MKYNINSTRNNTLVNRSLSFTFLVLLLSLSSIAVVHADSWNIILNGKAIHFDDAPVGTSFNENNWGVGVQYDFDEIDGKWIPFVAANGFNDSLKNASYNAGGGVMRRFKFNKKWHFDAGLYGFVMTRKDVDNNSPFMGILPVFSVGTDKVSVNITYVPKVRPKFSRLLFLQLKINTGILD